MAKTTSKSASKQKVSGGGSGKMHKFTGVGTQTPGQTAGASKGGGKSPGAKIPAGGSGKMHKFSGVGSQKPGVTSVSKGK
jgi:hypothetical protein